jgi:membrane protein
MTTIPQPGRSSAAPVADRVTPRATVASAPPSPTTDVQRKDAGSRGRRTRWAPPRRTPKALVVELVTLLKDTGVRWYDDDCLRTGASLSYYAVFSIFPLLLLAVTGVGFVLGHSPDTRARLLDSVARATSPAFKALFEETLGNMQTHETARGVGAVVGVITLFVGASAVFSELETTLNHVWRVEAAPSKGVWSAILGAVKEKALSFAVVIGTALALLGSLAVSSALSAVGQTVEGAVPGAVSHVTLWILAEAVGSVGVLTLVLAAMFRLIPQAPVEWRDVFGGALVSALLFTSSKGLLAWYFGHLGSYAAYGAVGGFLALLTWIYLASLFLFYGAEFTRVYAERHGSLSATAARQSASLTGERSAPSSPRPPRAT